MATGRIYETKLEGKWMTGAEAVSALPASLRIGPYDFAIIKESPHVSAGKAEFGHSNIAAQHIAIKADMPTAGKAVDTFFHEAMHACFWAYGIQDEDKEERTVGALGTALLALHRDNPWLSSWITRALE